MRARIYLVMAATLSVMCAPARVKTGAAQPVGTGSMWAWTEHDDSGHPIRIGITMTHDVLSGLPDSYDQVELPLPGRFDVPPYEHVVVGWDPLGHNPAAYAVPHFDFIFYFAPPETVGAIPPGPDSVPVPDHYRPPDYFGVLAEPAVGVHWGDTTASEMHGQPFTATFVYGFHNGGMIFLEPMVTSDFLEREPSFSAPVKQPAQVQRTGFYPTSYSVKYNPKDSTISISLDGLRRREREVE